MFFKAFVISFARPAVEQIFAGIRFIEYRWIMYKNNHSNTNETGKQQDPTKAKQGQWTRESEEKFRVLFENNVVAVLLTMLDGSILSANPVACAMLGCSESELCKSGRSGILDTNDPRLAAALEERQRTGQVQARELTAIRKNGERFPVEVDSVILSTEPTQSFVIMRDITERKKTEQRLQKNNDRLRMALEATNLGTWEYNPQAHEIFLDERSQVIFGVSTEVLDLPSFMAFVYPEDRDRLIKTVKDGLSPLKGHGVIDFRILRADGEVRWVNTTGKSYFEQKDARRRAVHSIGTNMDITDRKRAEEALRESEERLRLATEAANMYGWEVDLHSNEFKPSENVKQVANNPMPKTVPEVWERIHPEDLPEVKKTMRQAVEDRGEFRIEYRIKDTAPDREVWYFSAGMTITGTDGKPIRVVGVTQNITKRKRAEEMLRRWSESLEQQVAERTELAETRAKQLQVLAVELVEAEERERKRIAVLLHDDLQQLLAGARLQQQAACNALPDDSPPLPIFLRVDALLEESIEKSRRLSQELSPPVLHHSGLIAGLKWLGRQMEKQFGLHVELEAGTVASMDDTPLKVFLFRAVQELLFNIVKHAGVKETRVALACSDTDLIVTVSDQGHGFDPKILESSLMTAGFGLISLRERARTFGGSLMIESIPGRGSQFMLKVPLGLLQVDKPLRIEKSTDFKKPAMQMEPKLLGTNGNVRVLLADDHQVMRQALIAMLEGKPGLQVVGEAANGREALEQVRALNPDVVVMDVSMPEMDGVEATRQIKAKWPEIRVISLSMYDDDQIVQTMQQAGAEGFISKTASSFELLQAIYGIPDRGQA